MTQQLEKLFIPPPTLIKIAFLFQCYVHLDPFLEQTVVYVAYHTTSCLFDPMWRSSSKNFQS